jgi:hypothetical protein
VARQLSNKVLIHLNHIINSILRLSYFPLRWKVSVIILIPKPGKLPFGIQQWGASKKSNIYKILSFQSTTLRIITKAPFYVTNYTLHTVLNVPKITETANSSYKLFRARLANHLNPLILTLNSNTIPGNTPRRLKRNWCRDLI